MKLTAEQWLKFNGWSNQYVSHDGWKTKTRVAELMNQYAASLGTPEPEEGRVYTLIFLFSPDYSRVLLLRKATPEWQRGLWNGPGGLVEPGETELAGAVRELREEATISIQSELVFVLKFSCDCERFKAVPVRTLHHISVFAATVSGETLESARGTEKEPVSVFPVSKSSGRVAYVGPLLALSIERLQQREPSAPAAAQSPDKMLGRHALDGPAVPMEEPIIIGTNGNIPELVKLAKMLLATKGTFQRWEQAYSPLHSAYELGYALGRAAGKEGRDGK